MGILHIDHVNILAAANRTESRTNFFLVLLGPSTPEHFFDDRKASNSGEICDGRDVS
jgi:hypothetical protein